MSNRGGSVPKTHGGDVWDCLTGDAWSAKDGGPGSGPQGGGKSGGAKWEHDQPSGGSGTHKYNASSVNSAIKNNRTGKIGGREASAIHRLLKGRTGRDSKSDDAWDCMLDGESI